MASNAELERVIAADLDTDAHRLVYADWLQQQGDPFGELALAQHALASGRGTPAIEARELELRAQVLEELGLIFERADVERRHHRYRTNGMDPVWRLGFLDSVRITAWYALDMAVRDVLRLVARHPAARFLRRLRFGDTTHDYSPIYDHSYDGGTSLLDTLVEVAIPTLRVLELGAMDCRSGETELSWIVLGNVGKVLRAYPQLREVVLTGTGESYEARNFKTTPNPMRLELGAIDMRELRRFELRTSDLRRSQLASILDAKWPALEHLEVWFGDAGKGAECVVEDVLPLFEQPSAIRHLALRNADFTDDLVDPLAASPLLAQLETLDLSLGCLTDEGARELRDHEPAFRHLRRLVLDRCQLTDDGIAAVRGLCADVSVEDQRDSDSRFVGIME